MTDAELIKWLETNSEELDGSDLRFLMDFMDDAIGIMLLPELQIYEIGLLDDMGFSAIELMNLCYRGYYDPSASYFRFDAWEDFESTTWESMEDECEEYRDEIIGAFIDFVNSHDFKMDEFEEEMKQLTPLLKFDTPVQEGVQS